MNLKTKEINEIYFKKIIELFGLEKESEIYDCLASQIKVKKENVKIKFYVPSNYKIFKNRELGLEEEISLSVKLKIKETLENKEDFYDFNKMIKIKNNLSNKIDTITKTDSFKLEKHKIDSSDIEMDCDMSETRAAIYVTKTKKIILTKIKVENLFLYLLVASYVEHETGIVVDIENKEFQNSVDYRLSRDSNFKVTITGLIHIKDWDIVNKYICIRPK